MAGSTLFDFNSFISNGFVRAHIIFLGDLLGWPLLHINLGAKDLTPVGYTAGPEDTLIPVLAPSQSARLGAKLVRALQAQYPDGALVLRGEPLRDGHDGLSLFSTAIWCSRSGQAPLWLSAETHCLTDALEHIEGVWRPKRVFDSDGRASQDFSRACHPKWQLEHLEDDFDVEDWIDVPGDD